MAGPVRHPIDVAALELYLAHHVPEIQAPPLDVKQFGYGQSNPTYQLTDRSGARYVMRKKPPGRLVSRTAHQIEREHLVISALHSLSLPRSRSVPVPRPLCLCDDPSIVGTPFYVMTFLDGRIFPDPALPGVSATDRAAMWTAALATLARLHAVDFRAAGLADLGPHAAFYARQLRTWTAVCAAQAAVRDVDSAELVGPLPRQGELVAFFAAEAPPRPRDRATVVHGDYKMDNIVFHKTEPRVIGVLDWEMSTIGHPLSDLANLLQPYAMASHPVDTPIITHRGFRPGATPGLPTREEAAEIYRQALISATASSSSISPSSSSSSRTSTSSTTRQTPKQPQSTDNDTNDGWWPSGPAQMEPELRWAQAFNMFRAAAVAQGIAARVARRQASSEQAMSYSVARGALARYAWDLVEEVKLATGAGAAGAAGADADSDAGKVAKAKI